MKRNPLGWLGWLQSPPSPCPSPRWGEGTPELSLSSKERAAACPLSPWGEGRGEGVFPKHSPRIAAKAAFCAALALSGLAAQGAQARDRDPAEEAQRWQDVREPVFHGRPIQDAGEEVKLIAPDRAMDAALVPLTVELHAKKRVTAVTVFIDNNPLRWWARSASARRSRRIRSSSGCASTITRSSTRSPKPRTERCWPPSTM